MIRNDPLYLLNRKKNIIDKGKPKKQNKLGLSWAKLSHSCVDLIRSFDMLSNFNGLD